MNQSMTEMRTNLIIHRLRMWKSLIQEAIEESAELLSEGNRTSISEKKK